MNITDQQAPIESQTGPDDIIHTEIDSTEAGKDNVQEQLEGAEPSEDETEVTPKDAKIFRSE